MRNSAIARLLVMAFLTICLLIPLSMVQGVVGERAGRRSEAVTRFSEEWGGQQTVAGPVLSVPYTTTWTDNAGRIQRASGRAHVLPRDVNIEAKLNTEVRKRGIFEVTLYHTDLRVSGRFVRSDLNWIRPAPDRLHWDEATVSVGISDPSGLTRRTALTWNGRDVPFSGGVADVGVFSAGIQARVPELETVPAGTELPFNFTLSVNGTRDLRFAPTADETVVNVAAPWPHPSFVGAPLPEDRRIDSNGFTARWHVPDFGRPYPARWTNADVNHEQLPSQVQCSAFGVSLIQPVDIYQQAERAVKYAVLFLVLTFVVFFMWEIFSATLLHPVQYAFVGFAMCLFYLLLISLSEHAGFDVAYAISAVVTTALIGGYARAILGGRRQAVSVAASLAGIYGFLYLLLRLEDYALLAGSIGLFLVLAVMMYITRRMNWYELRLGTEPR